MTTTLRTRNYPVSCPIQSSNVVRILSWNVRYGDYKHAKEVIKALRRFDCDVLLLYEVNDYYWLSEQIHHLGYGGRFVETNRFGAEVPVHGGIALFSRFEFDNMRTVTLREGGRGPFRGGMRSFRAYIEARLLVAEDVSLTVGGAHISHRFTWDLAMRTKYQQECAALLRETGRREDKFVFGADLNAPRWFRIVKDLREQLVHLGPDIEESSFPMCRLIGTLGPWLRIDYMFGTPDIKVRTIAFGNAGPSDHSPIIAELLI